MPREAPKRERVNISEASAILGVSARTIHRLAARGELPTAAKVGRCWTFNEAAIRAWLVEQESKPKPRIGRRPWRTDPPKHYGRGGYVPDDGGKPKYKRVIDQILADLKAKEKRR